MPAEKSSTSSKCSENRRSNKPIMEKRRRARINSSLNDLKALILEALKKDPARHSKLEKADILEMTVKHLQNLQRQQMALAAASDPSIDNKFRAGFDECAKEVTRYLGRLEDLDPGAKQRLLAHLTNCTNGLNIAALQDHHHHNRNQHSLLGGASPPFVQTMHGEPLNIHMATVSPIMDQSSQQQGASAIVPPAGYVSATNAGLQLVPTRLPNGDFALLLPTNYSSTLVAPMSNISVHTNSSKTPTNSPVVGGSYPPMQKSPLLASQMAAAITPPLTPSQVVAKTALSNRQHEGDSEMKVETSLHDLRRPMATSSLFINSSINHRIVRVDDKANTQCYHGLPMDIGKCNFENEPWRPW